VSAVLVVNTMLVAMLQVRMSRGTEDVGRAAAVARRAGLFLAVSCAVYAAATSLPAWAALAVILAGAVLHTLGEVWFSAGATALSFDLAPTEKSGAYQGVFQAGSATGLLLAPALVTNTALRFGIAGWLALGAVYLAAGALLPPCTRWAVARQAAHARPLLEPPVLQTSSR
jgi:hypothetical protein